MSLAASQKASQCAVSLPLPFSACFGSLNEVQNVFLSVNRIIHCMMKVAASSSDKGARGQCSDLERGMVKWNDATPSRADRQTVPKRGAPSSVRGTSGSRNEEGMVWLVLLLTLTFEETRRTAVHRKGGSGRARREGRGKDWLSPTHRVRALGPALTPSTVWLRQLQWARERNGGEGV